MMPSDGLKILADCDAILLGAVGFPGVPDHVSLRELLLPIRVGFDQYVNLRPVKLLPGLSSPIKNEKIVLSSSGKIPKGNTAAGARFRNRIRRTKR